MKSSEISYLYNSNPKNNPGFIFSSTNKMSKVTLFLSFIVFCVVFEVVISTKPVASKDCSTLVYNMIDCLSFVSNDSKVSKPEGTCCNGLKTVLRTDASCVCEGFKSSSQFGIKLNKTRAVSLPSKCGLNVPPSVNHCGMSPPPSAAPAQPPSLVAPAVQVVTPAVSPAGSSSDTDNVNVAPAPSSSGEVSSANSVSLIALLLASLVAAAA